MSSWNLSNACAEVKMGRFILLDGVRHLQLATQRSSPFGAKLRRVIQSDVVTFLPFKQPFRLTQRGFGSLNKETPGSIGGSISTDSLEGGEQQESYTLTFVSPDEKVHIPCSYRVRLTLNFPSSDLG